jgi:hypothetical protein
MAGFGAGAKKGHHAEGDTLTAGQRRSTNRANAVVVVVVSRGGQPAVGTSEVSATVAGQSIAAAVLAQQRRWWSL